VGWVSREKVDKEKRERRGGMMEESAMVLTYGVSGIGKTCDQGYSFPTALFVAAPGALNSIQSVCGYTPANTQVPTIPDATALIKKVAGRFRFVVIDDFSFLAEQTFSAYEKKYTGFKLWGALRDAALEFRDSARFSKVTVVMNSWLQAPKKNARGEYIRGGPALSGKLPEQIPALCDVVLQGAYDARRQPWPGIYRGAPDADWVRKDRFNIAPIADPCPMNLGEVLRAGGMDIPRHPDIENQEAIVEALCVKVIGEPKPLEVANKIFPNLVGLMGPSAARWTLRDALDRAEIRKALELTKSTFVATTNALL
jgi:hypothetical protein